MPAATGASLSSWFVFDGTCRRLGTRGVRSKHPTAALYCLCENRTDRGHRTACALLKTTKIFYLIIAQVSGSPHIYIGFSAQGVCAVKILK